MNVLGNLRNNCFRVTGLLFEGLQIFAARARRVRSRFAFPRSFLLVAASEFRMRQRVVAALPASGYRV